MDKKEIDELKKMVKNRDLSIHVPYKDRTGSKADFEVEYVLDIDPELGSIILSQGMRCDFLYDGDNPKVDGVHMIWPELLDENGSVILDKSISLDNSGKATMWIGLPETRAHTHRKRIKVGAKGSWVVGSKRIAKVTVTKIIGLFENND
jgi:hypothetical protein